MSTCTSAQAVLTAVFAARDVTISMVVERDGACVTCRKIRPASFRYEVIVIVSAVVTGRHDIK